MDEPGSIYEEAVRVLRVYHMILEFGFLEFLKEKDVELLIDSIIYSDIDLHRKQEEWLPDLIKTTKWFFELHKSSLVEDDWFDMLLTAVRRQGQRLDRIYDDDDDDGGESWKRVH